jgi:hypothetical protein
MITKRREIIYLGVLLINAQIAKNSGISCQKPCYYCKAKKQTGRALLIFSL